MNQNKKRKILSSNQDLMQVKKPKITTHNTEHQKLKSTKKKKKTANVNTDRKKENVQQIVKTVSDSKTKASSSKPKGKQWQSIKEKRKRMKKKYLAKNDGVVTSQTESHCKNNEEAIKLPQNANEYSSNWRNLMKELHIPQTKKKSKKKKIVTDSRDTPQVTQEEKPPEIWFDDVDDILLEKETEHELSKDKGDKLVKQQSYTGVTKDVAIDCEMVGVGWNGKDNQLARVSIVNHFGNCICDKFVKPKEKVVDYRTHVSGIRYRDLENGEEFEDVQKEVASILNGRLLIGHAVHNDLKVLYISHPKKMIRDTSKYKPFRQLFDGRNPSLKKLTAKVLGVAVQEGEHSSIQDAQAAMRLYTMHRKQWEKNVKSKHGHVKKGLKKERKKIK